MKPMALRTPSVCHPQLLTVRRVGRASRRSLTTRAAAWNVEIYSHTPFDVTPKSDIDLKIVDKDGKETALISVNPWPIKQWSLANELVPGRVRSGQVEAKDDFGTPGAVILKKRPSKVGDGSYISYIKLTKGAEEYIVPANSWVWSDDKDRVFFNGAALPQETPAGLQKLRVKDLESIRGTKEDSTVPRKEGDRIIDYDVYTDLGAPPKELRRAVLGGKTWPFPRRLRTGRAKVDGFEVRPEPTKWWLPPDEKFSYTKLRGFQKGSVLAAVPALGTILSDKLGHKAAFTSFKEVFALLDTEGKGLSSYLPSHMAFAPKQKVSNFDLGSILKLNENQVKVVDGVLDATAAGFELKSDILERQPSKNPDQKEGLFAKATDLLQKAAEARMAFVKDFKYLFQGVDDISDILKFRVPKVLEGRADAWYTDEEFGRQTFAGIDPSWVQVARKLPEGSLLGQAKGLAESLEGNKLEDLLAAEKPRLFILNYFPVIESFLDVCERVADAGALHAGRCLLYKRNDGYVVPVSIELKAPSEPSAYVYSPKDAPQIWLLAKQMISNLNAVVHQGWSHYGRCHACTEPYILSTYRHLSAMHPVYQLLRPHFRYTLQINQNARKTLVSGGGIVEKDFTPGSVVMEVVSKVYGAVWRFDQQALPADLKARGFMDEAGNLLVENYPYAEDGMLYWKAYTKFFKEYLSLYYTSSEAIAADTELQAWWDEIKTVGHADVTVGWPELSTVDDLVTILNTIAWTASVHHSAVNFGQYEFAAFSLNRPTYIQKYMPAPDSPEYKALATATGAAFEKVFLSYMPPPTKAASVALIVKLLSGHSLDEQYLIDGKHDWFKGGPAKEAFNSFVGDIKNVEETLKQRNSDPASLARNPTKGGMPYTMLIPSSPQSGVTARGVPYSVSI